MRKVPTQHNPATAGWEPAQPLGWAPGLDAEVSRTELGYHWVLYWHAAELAHGTARTRAGRVAAVYRARRRWRDAGPAVGALLELRARAGDSSDVEQRLIGRRCRCSRPATVEVRDCEWHSSVSAGYAADLERALTGLVAVPLPADLPTFRRRAASAARLSATIVAAIRRAAKAGHTGGRTDRPTRPAP